MKFSTIIRSCLLGLVLLLAGGNYASAQYDKDMFMFRGRNAIADGKYAEAIENFNVLASLDTTDYWTYFFRGIAKYNLGDVRGALTDFNTSVRLDPVFTNGYHYRAITLSRTGRYDEALNDLQTAIKLRPGLVGLYFSRGVTYFLAGRFKDAVKDFDKYLKKETKDPSAYLNRGASYLFLGDTLKAVNDYNRAIKIDRFEPEAYIRRGRLYAEQGRYDLAIADMDRAIELDPSNTFAYFNRALMHYDRKDYNAAMADLNRVLKEEPGNALTLYNRSLILAQVGDLENALADMDRVININPGNVLAYYNRAAFFIEMERWEDALYDYDKAIELYPDFAKAYMNRSYVKNMLGLKKGSKSDYDTAQQKIAEYRAKNAEAQGSFADTTKKYSSLLALDADFAKKDFDNELLQHRDIDIKLRPLYKVNLAAQRDERSFAISRRYENPLVDRFLAGSAVPVVISNEEDPQAPGLGAYLDAVAKSGIAETKAQDCFFRGLYSLQAKQYSSAMNWFDQAIKNSEDGYSGDPYAKYYKAFYYMCRGTLRSDMIEYIASIQSNVQTLTMDDKGAARARVSDKVNQTYDYSEAIEDMLAAVEIAPDIPYFQFNLGNLNCLSTNLVEAIECYDKSISQYPYFGDAFFNRGLVLIYLKDKEKGCIDLSRAGELGVADAYSVINKYCKEKE